MISRSLCLAATTAALLAAGGSGPAAAHTPLFACYDNFDGTVFCEGGFSDGSSAAGVAISVTQGDQAVLTGALDADSTIEFDKPDGAFVVRFDAGPGHEIEVPSDAIE